MRFKKLASAIAALAVGVSCFAGMTTPAGAAETAGTYNPTVDVFFNGDETVASSTEAVSISRWYLTGGKFGDFALLKFDISDYLSTYPISDYKITAELSVTGYSSDTENDAGLRCAYIPGLDDSWDDTISKSTATKLYGNGSPTGSINAKVSKSGDSTVKYDVSSAWSTADANGIATFALYADNTRNAFAYLSESSKSPVLTVTAEKVYDVAINSTNYAKVTFTDKTTNTVAETSYTDKDGNVTVRLKNGTYGLSVEKGGYNTKTQDITVNSADIALTDYALQATDSLFYEDFNTANGDNWSMEGAPEVTSNDGVLTVSHPSGANGQRHATKDITDITPTKNGIRATFKFKYSILSDRSQLITFIDFDGNRMLSVGNLKDDINNIYVVNGGAAITGTTEDSPTVVAANKICAVGANTEYTVTADIDFINKTVTATVGENSVTIPLTTTSKTISKIDINPGRKQAKITFDDLIIREYEPVPAAPSITAATTTAATAGATAIDTVPEKATEIEADGTETENAATNITADDTVHTVYIKVANPTDARPVITVDGIDYVSHATAFTHTNGIYVYQFVNINPVGAKVTYTGAAAEATVSES